MVWLCRGEATKKICILESAFRGIYLMLNGAAAFADIKAFGLQKRRKRRWRLAG